MMTVSVPVLPVVKAYVNLCLPREDGMPVLRDTHPLGKLTLRLMKGKTGLNYNAPSNSYPMHVELGMAAHFFEKGKVGLCERGVRDFNALARSLMYEHLYMHLIVQWSLDPKYNIRQGITRWAEALGIGENDMSIDTAAKNFQNWRMQVFPAAKRGRGRYHNTPLLFSNKTTPC
jgi:hypothetical protein